MNITLYQKPEKIVFVHVGKAGGTSARENFRKTFRKSSLNTRYVHLVKPNVQMFDTFIVTIRNPIDRMISWFLHVHPKNEIVAHRYPPTFTEIFDCYEQIDDFATHGLS